MKKYFMMEFIITWMMMMFLHVYLKLNFLNNFKRVLKGFTINSQRRNDRGIKIEQLIIKYGHAHIHTHHIIVVK